MKRKLWGGFTGGRLDWFHADAGWGGFGVGDFVAMPAIFHRRKDAESKYDDVREVIVTEARKPKRKSLP